MTDHVQFVTCKTLKLFNKCYVFGQNCFTSGWLRAGRAGCYGNRDSLLQKTCDKTYMYEYSNVPQ